MEETWRNIANFEGYMISNTGKVFSTKTNKYIKLEKHNDGNYIQITVRLCKNSKYYTKIVSRLVAEAFIPNPNNYPEVNHIDENSVNNNVDNLEWCNKLYNMNYGNRSEKASLHYINGVTKLDINTYKPIAVYRNYTIAAKNNKGTTNVSIRNHCLNRNKNDISYKGFFWRKANNEELKLLGNGIWTYL